MCRRYIYIYIYREREREAAAGSTWLARLGAHKDTAIRDEQRGLGLRVPSPVAAVHVRGRIVTGVASIHQHPLACDSQQGQSEITIVGNVCIESGEGQRTGFDIHAPDHSPGIARHVDNRRHVGICQHSRAVLRHRVFVKAARSARTRSGQGRECKAQHGIKQGRGKQNVGET